MRGNWHARFLGESVVATPHPYPTNAATYWATHEGVRTSSRDNIAAIVLEREARVARMVESGAFQRLAA